MTENLVISVLKDALHVGIITSAPILITATLVGLAIAILQATTQVQEQTLTFVPKILIASLVGLLVSGWMLHKLVDFTYKIFEIISNITI
ncbi:flagellar biosynthetic protein FliQ [Clostridium tepidiprofundi DSM 19306]|uniref:Flagellar biosynthetic protein FliQ n=1 Tax=Clostridium tepidiprofundi DSM 19306 TaxID=1121338 RepID=A0A151B733_9CLOT|nr:flagellar biosynthesis protein FliQ [Clostridium tepidiprofundi]KYH35613.1 flagellar biosynthetic protein FliQ [Clostridium tepidiprofundi DSM 19306]